MWNFIFSSIWGWIGTAAIIAAVSFAVAWFIKPMRPYALAVAGVAIAVATIYAKGSRDRARLEQKRKDEAVAKARRAYDEIDRSKANETEDEFLKKLDEGKWGGG